MHVDFLVLVEKPMLNNTFQLVFKGGDIRRIVRLEPAFQSAPHWIAKPEPSYLEPNRNTMQKPIGGLSVMALFSTKNSQSQTKVEPIYKGAIVCRERISSQSYPNHFLKTPRSFCGPSSTVTSSIRSSFLTCSTSSFLTRSFISLPFGSLVNTVPSL